MQWSQLCCQLACMYVAMEQCLKLCWARSKDLLRWTLQMGSKALDYGSQDLPAYTGGHFQPQSTVLFWQLSSSSDDQGHHMTSWLHISCVQLPETVSRCSMTMTPFDIKAGRTFQDQKAIPIAGCMAPHHRPCQCRNLCSTALMLHMGQTMPHISAILQVGVW